MTSAQSPESPLLRPPEYQTFAAACRQLGVNLSGEQFSLLVRYQAELTAENERINLISRKDTSRIFSYHIIDSLAVSRFISGARVCADIGTGAGLPGIPLAVVRPDLTVFLIESVQKKCRFLAQVTAGLELKNIRLLCARAESLPPLDCDVILSRLTGELKLTLRHSIRHLKPGGIMILYKSAGWEAELKRNFRLLARLRLKLDRVETVRLPFTGIERQLVFLVRAS
ncbi:MAG: 16S rRNA (guanine(527)-N(7))-methyltransferase RsmG [candidate division WOR-3 bacterium]|uniref:Ribosomal RNA small subunit methyltransferase G n=1 Tax=candidate division WOR-3 bacterium TaxID=2052148 RepID=A0A7C3IX34_UNCW3|nr:16S rRNA (guanine(527)-N(7))-methyltransferase RsmG [candidate division WOR-3 bacterium]